MAKEYVVKGNRVTLYTISDLANAIGRDTITVRKWELHGFIPRAAMRTKSGYRLYTKAEIETLAIIVKEENLRIGQSFKNTKLKERVFADWAKIRKEGLGSRNVIAEIVNGGIK